MGMIWAYLLFALTTAIAAYYELLVPVFQELEVLEPEDTIVQNKTVAHVTAFILSILTAPILIVPTLIPSAGETFRKALVESLIV